MTRKSYFPITITFFAAAAVGTAAALFFYFQFSYDSGSSKSDFNQSAIVQMPILEEPMTIVSVSPILFLPFYCAVDLSPQDITDSNICFRAPKNFQAQLIEVDLTKMLLYYYEYGVLKKEYKIISKGNPLKWWRTPTSKFVIGRKGKSLWSSRFPVALP